MTDREILLRLQAAIDRLDIGPDRARVGRMFANYLVPEVKQLMKEAIAEGKRGKEN